VAQGLSIANNLLANQVQLNLDVNQAALTTVTNQLSSGLRINTAADDPSGLAIATGLQSQADGFNTAVQNVQNANNAVQVALGAFSTTTDILQRIRSLAIEAASDVNSNNDRENLQAEVAQLLLEVNRIAQNTNFNGQPLLDGSHAGFQPSQTAYFTVTANTALATNGNLPQTSGINYGFLIASAVPSNPDFFKAGAAAPPGHLKVLPEDTVDGTIELQVVNTGVSIAVQETFIQSATGYVFVSSTLFGPAAVGTTYKNILAFAGDTLSGFDNVGITLGAITTNDVGTTAFIKVSQFVPALTNPENPAFNFQSGADEGDVIQVGIAATNTASLRISAINLLTSDSNNPSLGAEDAIGQVDIALRTLLGQQADLGAVVVRLNEDANNDNIAAINLQASESSIRDLNVGTATTQFTKLQILVDVGTSVLSHANSNADTILQLFH
jgi:flagellin